MNNNQTQQTRSPRNPVRLTPHLKYIDNERENQREDEGADRAAHDLRRRDAAAELRAAEGRAGREG